MEKDKAVAKVVLIFLILFFCLLCAMLFVVRNIKNNSQGNSGNIDITTVKEPENVGEVLEKYNSELLSQERNRIYAFFSHDLYGEDGSNNKNFFDNLVEDMSRFFPDGSFELIDEDKNISLLAQYDPKIGKHRIIINNIEDFYSKTDGDSYIKVETTEIAKGTTFAITNDILTTLRLHENRMDSILEYLDEGKDLGNGYTSYQNGTIKIRTVPTGGVKNIIFSEDYDESITYKLNTNMTLREIAEAEKNYDFGSVEKGYLGYRHKQFYLFFHDDEVSVYTYSYKRNTTFEEYLEEYLETKDLDRFVKNLSVDWLAYDSFEYDPETKSAHILYSTRGVDINIKDNDPTGITLYNNYYLTSLTKKYVKNGLISFDPYTDLVEKIELERRNND